MNVHRWDPKLEEVLRYIQWPCIVTSVEDWDMWGRLKAEFPFLLIHRPILNGNNADNKEVEPSVLVNYVRDHTPKDIVDVVQGYNELIINDEPTQIEREFWFARAVQDSGFAAISMCTPVGNVEAVHIPVLMPLIRESVYIGYGGYVKPGSTFIDTVHEPYWLRRPELIWAPEIERQGMPREEFLKKLIFRETGTYYGWGGQCTPTEYGELLATIDLYARIIGAKTSPFTLTAHEPWRTQTPFEFIDYQDTLDALREYRQEVNLMAIEYGFPGVYDGFNTLADRLGHEVVGEPLHVARYVGGDLAYQLTTAGTLVAVKLDNGEWISRFIGG